MTAARIAGRDAELAAIRQRVTGLARGRGGLVWIEGEPGIGKSALISAALDADRPQSWRLFRAAGDEFMQMFALHVLCQALGVDGGGDPVRAGIAELLAGRIDGYADPVLAASERILALVDQECARSPVALVVDDLQWADDASLAVWRRLAGLADQLPLLLVGLTRPVPRRPEVDLTRASAASTAVMLRLGALGENETATVARWLTSGAAPGPRLRAVLAQTGGNPLYVHETVDVLLREGLVDITGDTAELVGDTVPDASCLAEVIGRRLGFLTSRVRASLRIATLLDVRFAGADLAMAADLPATQLDAVVAEGVSTGVLAEGDGELWFRHPLIRLTLHEELPPAIRLGLHHHIARSLADTRAPWHHVARHLLAGPDAIDGWALDWLTRSDPSNFYSHPAVAADLLRRALQETTPGETRHAVLTTRLTTVLRLLHRQDELVALAETSLMSMTDPHLVGETAWNLVKGLGLAGRFAEAMSVLQQVGDGRVAVAPWRSRLAAMRVPFLGFAGQIDQAQAQAELAIEEANRDGDPVSVGWALHWLYLLSRGNKARLAILDRALSVVVGDDPESLDIRLLLTGNRLTTLSDLFGREAFHAAFPAALALAEQVGSARGFAMKLVAAEYFLRQGEWDESRLCLEQISGPADTASSLRVHGASMLIAVRRAEWSAAQRQLAAVADIPYRHGPLRMFANNLLLAQALLAEAEGQPAAAVAILGGFVDPDFPDEARIFVPEIMRELVRLALAAGDRATALAATEAAETDRTAAADDVLGVNADICRAMVDDVPEALLAAADRLTTAEWWPATAFALEEAAVRLAQRGDDVDARAAFVRAVGIYEDLGAAFDVRRIQARLREFGIRLGPRGKHRRVTVGWDALTPTEREVAHHIRQRLSNTEIAAQMFLSRRTVETHVAHILAKLEVQSRGDVTQRIVDHEAATGSSDDLTVHVEAGSRGRSAPHAGPATRRRSVT